MWSAKRSHATLEWKTVWPAKVKQLLEANVGWQSKGVITWRISARLARLRFQPRFRKKSSWNESGDYMEKVSVWAEFQPWLKMFIPSWKVEKPHVIAAKFQPELKREFEQAHWRNIQPNKMAVMEKLCLNPCWNSPCNCNKISAGGAGSNSSLDRNSPCNQPLNKACARDCNTHFGILTISYNLPSKKGP